MQLLLFNIDYDEIIICAQSIYGHRHLKAKWYDTFAFILKYGHFVIFPRQKLNRIAPSPISTFLQSVLPPIPPKNHIINDIPLNIFIWGVMKNAKLP